MTLNTSSMSVVEENTKSVEPPSAHGHGAKLQLSDGSSLYAKLVVNSNKIFLNCVLEDNYQPPYYCYKLMCINKDSCFEGWR